MKGYPPGYPATRYQEETARRHHLRRRGRPPSDLEVQRITDAQRRRGDVLPSQDKPR
jgi:hypothetical protein